MYTKVDTFESFVFYYIYEYLYVCILFSYFWKYFYDSRLSLLTTKGSYPYSLPFVYPFPIIIYVSIMKEC